MSRLVRDGRSIPIQAFVPTPALVQVPIVLTAAETIVLGRDETADIDISGWVAVRLYSNNDLTRYFNEDSTKIRTIQGGSEVTLVISDLMDTITITAPTGATVELEGM